MDIARTFTQIQVPHWKAHDGRILLLEKGVACESLDMDHEVCGKLLQTIQFLFHNSHPDRYDLYIKETERKTNESQNPGKQ